MSHHVTEEDYHALLLKQGKLLRVTPSPPVKKPNKYGAIRKTVDGYTFDSTGEAKRYIELRSEYETGWITGLKLQFRYTLAVNGVTICEYMADFVYYRDAALIVEDFKGHRTPVYELKKKLMYAIYGIEIYETGQTRGDTA